MSDEYTTRVGLEVHDHHPTTYDELLSRPAEDRDDDGTTIRHVGDWGPICADCGVGTLQWAEAGYVAWHRICDRCGSHWELHPIMLFLARAARRPLDYDAPLVGSSDGRAWFVETDGPRGTMPAAGPIPGGDGWTYEALVDQLRPELVDAALRDSCGGIPTIAACWARRARFRAR